LAARRGGILLVFAGVSSGASWPSRIEFLNRSELVLGRQIAVTDVEKCYPLDMAPRVLERIRDAVRERRYDVTKHAADEMAEDALDIIDVETSILNGAIIKTERDDPRGPRHTIHGIGADGITAVGSVGRFTETDQYLIITIYEVTDE
jgi:hypothetical protein